MLVRASAVFAVCLSFGNSAFAEEFSYENLVALIQGQQLTSLEQVLPKLPTDFRSNYTLMYKSRSLQQATPMSPRVILFGKSAKFTCAFTGDPSETGFDLLECIQFRDQERAFDFRQIRFPTADNHDTQVRFSERGRSVDGRVSCSACHGGADPRPNWDEYQTWPGSYGENDDEVPDASLYLKYVATRATHPRYRWLIQDSYATAPFDSSRGMAGRPNLRFSDLTNEWNSLRAVRMLGQTLPRWQTLAFAVSGAQCDLSQEQLDRIKQAGLDFRKDSDITAIFDRLGLPPGEWSTEIFGDSTNRYEHQGGFTYFLASTAMDFVQDLASGGNEALRAGVEGVRASYARDPYVSPDELPFFQELGSIVPDLNFFGLSIRRTRVAFALS